MLERFTIAVLLLACLPLCGCKRDAEINAIVAEIDAFTQELVRRVDSARNPSDGVDDAQKYFDSKKADLSAKMATLKSISGYRVSSETKWKMTRKLFDDKKRVAGLKVSHATALTQDEVFKAKLDKLVQDFVDLLSM
jgi:hypothetical protein